MSEAVRAMFASIARRYDRANGVLSFGRHRAWRRRAVRLSGARPGSRVLDVATGTGDLAFEFARRVGRSGRVCGADFCRPMLVEAVRKRRAAEVAGWAEADALRLPFRSEAFDVASIAFGIRNVDDPAAGVQELARVVRPGGRVVVLEFGQPGGLRKWPFRWYSRFFMPRIGGWITGHREAYEYLPRTAAAFPSGAAFEALMRGTGAFARVESMSLSGGIAHVYVGTVGAPKPGG